MIDSSTGVNFYQSVMNIHVNFIYDKLVIVTVIKDWLFSIQTEAKFHQKIVT